MKTILRGITGSKAYGLDTPESDTDERGAFLLPTQEILSVYPHKETIDTTDPDVCLHEVGKIVRLALQNNPNILELFYLESYTELTKEGQWLIDVRDAFLSQRVRKTYGGYAIAQVKRLETRAAAGDASFKSKLRKRYSKHARHIARLMLQGKEILRDGHLTVRLSTDEIKAVREVSEMDHESIGAWFREEMASLDSVDSNLPEEPNIALVNDTLLEIREKNW